MSVTDESFGRRAFLKTATVGLIGAGIGIGAVGTSVDESFATEPMVETCKWREYLAQSVAAEPCNSSDKHISANDGK